MPQQVTNIKKRIASIKGAYKITSAMKLISTVKLKKWRKAMLDNKAYADEISKFTRELFTYAEEVNSPYFNVNSKSEKKLYVIISSTLGLCGSYNNNILRLADNEISPSDDILVLGGKGVAHFSSDGVNLVKGFENYSNLSDSSFIKALFSFVSNKYIDGTYKEIHLIYSEYVNALVFKAKDALILPLEKSSDNALLPPIIEPSREILIEKTVPIYLKSSLYSKILESEVCEQASRSNAMENATKNAEDLLSQLSIEFNKARQGAITQEIIEIVACSQNV